MTSARVGGPSWSRLCWASRLNGSHVRRASRLVREKRASDPSVFAPYGSLNRSLGVFLVANTIRNGISQTRVGGMVRSNNALERTGVHRGRAVLAIDCVLGGAERAPCQAAQRDR
jgi:hypothetical protein